jgi:hypothetical protein
MARVTEGIFQGVHGKLGNVVFRRINGKTFLCKSPVFRKRKLTEKESFTRKKFAFTIAFVKRMMFLFRTTYQHFENGKSGFNRAVSHNYHEMVMGERPPFQVNYPKIVLSRGNMQLPEMMLTASLATGTITFIWTHDDFFYQNDIKVFFAIYCEELGDWRFDVDHANQSDCMQTIELPYLSGKPVHTYIGFVSADGHQVSNSHYTGMVNIL